MNARGEGSGGLGEKGEGVKEYKQSVMKIVTQVLVIAQGI